MKNKSSFIINLFLSILLIFGLLFCLISSFEISVNSPILIVATILFCTVYSLLASLVKKKGIFFAGVAITMIVFIFTLLFSLDYILAQLSYAVSQILSKYSVYLPVSNSISLGTENASYATGFFVFISVIYSAVFTISLIRYKKLFIIAIISVLTLIPCFILVNTLPSIAALILVVAILLTLYITSSIRKYNPEQNGIVSIISCAVIIIILATIISFYPIDGYERFTWQDNMLEYMQDLTGINSSKKSNHAQRINSLEKEEDLSIISSITQTHKKIMKVHSDTGGNMYLKGTAYADFSNNKWHLLTETEIKKFPNDFETFTITASDDTSVSQTSIITENKERVIYTPYYADRIPDGFSSYADVCITNDNMLLSYDISHYPYSPFNSYRISIGENKINQYKEFVYDTYLQIPETTRAELLKIAVKNDIANIKNDKIPSAVKEFVSNSASYSLDTPKIPEGKDFPVWFLNECDTGYCVHFASSAALMLRALGIPARYVTGYYANVQNSQWTTVTSDNAHAWVEYYNDEIGWIPLECTPASFSSTDNTLPFQQTETTTSEAEIPSSTVKQTENPTVSAIQGNTADTSSSIRINNSGSKISESVISLILILSIIISLLLTVIIRRTIIIKRRSKSMHTGSNKNKVINIYKYLLLINKYSHTVIPDRITEIIERAKFSRHSIDDSDVESMISYMKSCESELFASLSYIKKIYYKYIIVLK